MTLIQSKPVLASSGTLGYSQEIDRSFELTTAASGSTILPLTEGSVPVDWRSAGFLVEGRGINKTGLIYQYPNGRMDGEGNVIEVCPPVAPELYLTGPAPEPFNLCPSFAIPADWYVVGALSNGVIGVTHP